MSAPRMTGAREELIAIIEKRAVKARRVVDSMLAEIQRAERPIARLAWSDNLFEAAAALEVYSTVHAALTAIDSKATVASVHEWALSMVVSAAEFTPSSTSVTANLAARMAAPAWAAIYKEAEWLNKEPK